MSTHFTIDRKEEIEVPVWWNSGIMMYRRDALPVSHSESIYNYIKNTLKQEPERFGIFLDKPEPCGECGRSCLCTEE